jgi:hypothetical protein
MPKGEALLVRERCTTRLDELLAHELKQARGDPVTVLRSGQRLHRAAMKAVALDRSALERAALGCPELVEARGEQHLDGRRHAHTGEVARRHPAPVLASQETLVDEHRDHLLDEEGVAAARLANPRPHVALESDLADEVPDQGLGFVLRERLEEDRGRVALASSPRLVQLQQLRPRHAEEQDGGVSRPLRHVLDQLEQVGLGPVQVVEDDDQRTLVGEALEQPSHPPVPLLRRRRRLGQADHLGDALGRSPVRVVLEGRGDLRHRLLERVLFGDAGGLLDDLEHRPEGDPLAVG